MTTTQPRPKLTISQKLTHTRVITKRNLLRNVRIPQLLVFATIQPVMFLILFNYVFGGAITQGGPAAAVGDYINWLIPGILVQSAVFGSTQTAVGLTEDLRAGVIDRFRSLPMARSAVLTGRTNADTTRNLWVLGLMLAVGYLIGWRFGQGFLRVALAVLLVLFFAYAMSWVMACMGLAIKDTEAVQVAGFLPIFPLVFASSVFVPTDTMPDWLQAFAENQPITIISNAVRSLMLPEQAVEFIGFNQSELIWQSLAWTAGIILVFAPLAIRLYRRISD
ncbi:MAG: ABC transporter permease [Actinobacteria bacterium]|nr:MAG: ABC transporter permease [Actinomycetota bacterium]REK41010.1 MAG: ABC transporter permease [Actinomycetota bacterium]